MKRLSILALALFAAVAVAGSYTSSFDYSTSGLKLGTEQGYTTVDFPGGIHAGTLGTPDLPAIPYTVVIPADAVVTGLEIVSVEETPVPGEYDILPVQHPVPYMDNPPARPFVSPDPAVYGNGAYWPAPATLGPDGSKSGYRLATFAVHPVRYNPVTKQLSVVTRIRVKLSYDAHKRHVARYTETQSATHGDAVRALVLNPSDVARNAPPVRRTSYGSAFLPAGDYEHVVITRSVWADSLQRLCDWRTRQGWRSRIMTMEDICSTYPGRDTAEMMRNFIKDADTTWGTIFVFIARDDYPAHNYRVARAYNYDMYSDMYFSDLDGTWDANGNNVFGEVADNVDGYADVYVGMMTLNGFSELSNYIGKIFRYEQHPDTTGGWGTKQLLPNGVTFSNQYNDSAANASPSPPWFDLKMYASGGMVTPTGERYCDSLNSGYSLNSVIAHGSPDLYQLNTNVTSPMVNALTNADRLNFGTFVCCNVGEWNLGSTNGDCIAENSVFHAPNGFIGVCMNYESGWVAVAELFNFSIIYGALGFRTPRQVTMGEALSYGKDYWHWTLNDSMKWRMEAFERNLFGAPAVPIWTATPYTATATKPGAINIGTGIPVPITVTGPGDAPVDSALVCLVKGTETFARGWTDASGNLTLYVSPLTPGQMLFTVTCGNNLPIIDSIPVMAAGRFVAYLRSTVADTTGGNGDGIINPGETVQLRAWVKNYGSQTANSVTGRLITHTANVTITDADASFGNVAAEDSAYDANAWAIQVGNGLPNGYAVPCSVVCRDANDSVWVSYATWYVGAPALSYVSFEVMDGLDPEGVLDPGETADLDVTIRNGGLGHAYNVTAMLRSTDSRLTFPDSAAVYGTVMAGSTAVNTDAFTATADASIPKETVVECTLDLYGDNGYESHHAFSIEVGEVRSVDPIPDNSTPILYWAYDNGDSGYVQAPEFEWVDITGVGTRTAITSDDQTVQVTLPPAFGPFVFYGRNFTQLSLCGNGWVGPGYTTRTAYSNVAIPATNQSTMLALVWDDLYPPTSNGVWYYHDEANHRFIVQWDSMSYYSSRTTFDWFEVVIYDTTMAAEDGNSVFTYQYLTGNGFGSNTTGINDSTTAKGIQVVFDGDYDRGALPLEAGRAIKFSTDAPMTGVAEPPHIASLDRLPLVVAPNPFNRTAMVRYNLARDGDVTLRVYDAAGRSVRTLHTGAMRAGSHFAVWNGADDQGRRVAHGVYFVRLETLGSSVKVKTILTH